MKKIKFKFNLNSKVSIYVPSTHDVDKPVDNTAEVREVIGKLSAMFGGATASEAQGGWLSETGQVVTERVTIVYAFCKEIDLLEKFDDVVEICRDLKARMGQEAIALEVNGEMDFI